MRSELRCGVLFAPTGFARGSDSSRDARCDLERARNDATRMPNRRSPFEREIARDADARARLRARSWLSSCRDATDAKQPRPSPASVSGARADDDLPLSPRYDSETVKASAAKPAIAEKVEKLGKAALSGLAASAMLASVRLDSTTISPRARAIDRIRARATRREGRTGTNYARRPPPTSLHPVSPARAARTLPRRGSRALFPAPGARFPPLTGWWLDVAQLYDFSAARRPVPRPTVRASLTRRFPPSFPSSSSPVRERRHLRRVPGPHLPPGEGHRPCQHLPRRRDWRVRL